VWEIWPTLATGGTLVVPPDDVRAAPRDLVAWLAEHRITRTFLPTPLAEAVLDEYWPAGTALRLLLTGGDALRRSTPDGLPFTLVNHYGPTEATVVATAIEVRPGGPAVPPIGDPVGGTTAYVLSGVDPVPVGVPGELCVGGAGVARGYLGDPAATAAAFVTDPANPGQRMYRTGDRVRWLADGRLEFLGRIDEQVKIRGFRIEPGEIVAVLRHHPKVDDAFVVARPDPAGRLRLIGYAATDTATADLRAYLVERLPSYLVPDHLVAMAALPRNANGKVDKALLPSPSVESPRGSALSETEGRIAQLWRDLLGADAMAADDDFFGLGGYSLLVAKMLAQVDEVFGRTVPLAVFLTDPTLGSLARAVDSAPLQPPASQPEAGLDIDSLSDAEAEALLAILTAEGNSD
jgi:acyl-coenzyme A synthetase/AMP-(fatty) acid ligase